MPRYFFDYHADHTNGIDDDGLYLESAYQARQEAIAALAAMAKEELPQDPHRHMQMRVRDDTGSTVCTVQIKMQVVDGATA